MLEINKINLIVVSNPFDPREQIRTAPVLSGNATVATFIPDMFFDYVLSVNGGIVEKEDASSTKLKADDWLVIVPVPHGGGGSKNIFRMVALIALAVAAPYMAVGMMGAAAGTVGSLTALGTAVTMGITMVGSMLINAILPPSLPKSDNYNQGLEESKTYGIDGAKNTSTEDTVVPLVYGKYRVAGNRIATFIKNVDNTQDLYMMFNAGEGNIAGISDVEVNNQPIANYDNADYRIKLGTPTQLPMGWFGDNVVPISRGINVSESWAEYTTAGLVDKLRFDFAAPGGISFYNDEGGMEYRSVPLSIQYRKVGDTVWNSIKNINSKTNAVTKYYYSDTETAEATLRPGDTLAASAIIIANGDQVGVAVEEAVYSTTHAIGGKGRQPIRKSFETPPLEEAQYEVRVKRNNAESTSTTLIDAVQWGEINEITTERIAYRHTALLGMKIQLSDQLGSIPNVTYLHHGKVVKVRSVEEENEVWKLAASSNPAWVAYDILTNIRYGAGISETRFNIAQWQEWADHCDASGLEFNGVFDAQSNVWDSLMHVFRAGRAQIIAQGTKYTVAMERSDTPVMMFNSSNMVEKTFSISWLPKEERANEVEITYWDRTDGYKRSMIKYRDPDLLPSSPIKTARMTMFGITDPEQVKKEAVFQINLNKHILRTVEFDASIEAIACTVGSQILIQHEMPNWGEGGRMDDASTTTVINLDREVTVQGGNSYKLLVTFDTVSRVSGVLTGVVSNVIWLDGYDGRTDVKRIVINGDDHRIVRVVNDGSGGHGVELESVAGLIGTESYEIFDTDVIEERNVTNVPGTYTTLTMDVPFGSAPAYRSKWMFGTVETIKRPFRVQSIAGSHEYHRTIKALEYNEEVYNITTDAILPNYEPDTSISQVRSLTAENSWIKTGENYTPVAEIGWEIPAQGLYGGAHVYGAFNGGGYQKIGEVGSTELQYTHSGLSVGTVATFKVVAKDIIGQLANYSSAPFAAYTALARPDTGIPTNLTISTVTGSYVLTWNNPTETFKSIEVWRSTTDDVLTASKIALLTTETYTDSSAPLGVPVYYWVRTITADGLVGDWSAVNGATAPVPGQVQNLVTTAFTGRSVEIHWDRLDEANDYVVEVRANAVLSRSQITTDTSFKYTIEDAIQDGNVSRSITFDVRPRLVSSAVGATSSVVVNNTQIQTAVSGLVLGTTGDAVTVSFNEKTESDLAGYKIHASQTLGFTPSALNLVYQGRAAGTIFPVNPGETWYVVATAYDVWGEDGITYSGESSQEATTGALLASQLADQIDRTHLAATLESELDAIGAEWSVKVAQTAGDGTNYIAGIGLSIESGDSGALSSNVLVKADNFAILPSGTSVAADAALPFAVSGNQVFIDSAFIEDASITNAKIGNVIQSDTYSAVSGWKIDKAGAAEFTEMTIRDKDGNVIMQSGGAGISYSNDIANAGSGVNIANAEYSVWEDSLPIFGTLTDATLVLDGTVAYFGGSSLKLTNTSTINGRVWLGADLTDYNVKVTPNRMWLVSFMVRCSAISKAGEAILKTSDSVLHTFGYTTPATANEWVRVYGVIDLTANNSTNLIIALDNDSNVVSTDFWFDGLMIEELLGPNATPSAYVLPAGAGGGGVSDYADLTNAPTTLADINATESSKLTNIQANATVGAAFGTNISGQINSGNISTYIAGAAIQTAQIGDAQITNAKIGTVIQSNSYSPGTAGWKIDKNGNMELNSAIYRGTIDVKSATSGARLEIGADAIKVYDGGGVLRVKMGNLA